MPFNISPDIIQNDDVKIDTNGDGYIEITSMLMGTSLVIDNDLTVSEIESVSSASELTDVSADSVSDAHHNRYSDNEAQSAVDGTSLNALTLNNELTIPTYQSVDDVPSVQQGTVVLITEDNSLYVEDGS